jgi:hypothetical protein
MSSQNKRNRLFTYDEEEEQKDLDDPIALPKRTGLQVNYG